MENSTANMLSSVDDSTTEIPAHKELAGHTQFIIISVCYIIICVFGIAGNSMVIAAVALCRKLQTPTNVFVVSLAITDLLSCLTLPFQVVMFLSRDDSTRLPNGLCAFIGAISIICLVGSILTLALIAFNRCFLITQPRKRYSWLYTTKKLFAMTAMAWLYPTFILVLPQALGVGQLGYSPSYRACLWNESHQYAFVNDILVAITFLFTFIIILFCYIKIWIYIRHHVRRLRTHTSSKVPANEPSNLDDMSSTQEHHTDTSAGPSQGHGHTHGNGGCKVEKKKRIKAVSTREIEITKNLFYVVCAFFMCIIPYTITLVLPVDPILDLLVLYASIPLVFNGCVNPIIYAYKHPTMKVVFRYIIKCQIASIPKPSKCLRRALSLHQNSEVRGEGQIKTIHQRDGHPSFCSLKRESFMRQNSNNPSSRSLGSLNKHDVSPNRQNSANASTRSIGSLSKHDKSQSRHNSVGSYKGINR
ncbi:5-hydroxytryptamine receptor 1D-like [Lytechinus variegatus]|uniref:5-hydroxytryptamine receptor 1D-like n=1 Tax=Lytechinus variegatus TaxID=7654 RepID=UPI001BB27026|nr:5-hydroxytryptamine receptor 1D-like [Lytechinus variegatus]